MTNIITKKHPLEQNWLHELKSAFTKPEDLLTYLELEPDDFTQDIKARTLHPMRVTADFASRIKPRDPKDPLLLQIFPLRQEFIETPGFSTDPLAEKEEEPSCFLHKYKNRALVMLKMSCASNCRYCFRRHFTAEIPGNKTQWQLALDYVANNPQLDEIILSGGDPLMAKDHELKWFIEKLEKIEHIKRFRIHTRLPVMIPSRITDSLCELLQNCRFQVILVTHINHPNEIDNKLSQAFLKLKQANVTLLNQSTLLKGVNDDPYILAALSNKLFNANILPYYLHVLDHVQGSAHFLVNDVEASKLIRDLMGLVSGYLVPRLAREIPNRASKTLLNINMQ